MTAAEQAPVWGAIERDAHFNRFYHQAGVISAGRYRELCVRLRLAPHNAPHSHPLDATTPWSALRVERANAPVDKRGRTMHNIPLVKLTWIKREKTRKEERNAH